jgi:hypothetical protein
MERLFGEKMLYRSFCRLVVPPGVSMMLTQEKPLVVGRAISELKDKILRFRGRESQKIYRRAYWGEWVPPRYFGSVDEPEWR